MATTCPSADAYLALHGLSFSFLWLELITITLWMRPLYRPLEKLAHGQKCTVVLMVSMAEGLNPLIVDQPEDALHALDRKVCCFARGMRYPKAIWACESGDDRPTLRHLAPTDVIELMQRREWEV